MRLFIGISPSDDVRRSLVKMQGFLSRHGVSGAYSAPENLYMTLAFIGEYPESDAVLDAMEEVMFDPFGIQYDHIGTFRESIIWGGIESSEPLEKLVKRLRYELDKAEIPFDHAGFVPHFTLARHADFSRGIPSMEIVPVPMTVDQMILFRSDRGKNGMVYTPIGAVDACGAICTTAIGAATALKDREHAEKWIKNQEG